MAKLLGELLPLVFPHGTNAQQTNSGAGHTAIWDVIPQFAADVFAFSAYVIQLTGAMGFFDPNPNGQTRFKKKQRLKIVITAKDRKFCKKQSDLWKKNGVPGPDTATLWTTIYNAKDLPLSIKSYQNLHAEKTETTSSAPEWWLCIFKLAIIADEACDGIGHLHPTGESDNQTKDIEVFIQRLKEARVREAETHPIGGSTNCKRATKQVPSLCMAADPAVICVQPKGRVTSVGCSLRNISRNLSVTGPIGGVRCNWQQLASDCHIESRKSLNLLLIPLPYVLKAKNFKPKMAMEKEGWGSFEIEQEWLRSDQFKHLIIKIIKESMKDSGAINGIIFPEFALDFDIFASLMPDIFRATEGTLEFMISGSRGNCEESDGNNVLTAIWECNLGAANGIDWFRIVSQRKHHRWKMDRQQIATYGIGSALTPAKDWWEEHDIGNRELNFFQFRKDAVFASLICEDLARNDPCHDIIRSVAPNLVFALLMDGPQLVNRWPARYAGSLADDPGCAVLTFTSFGLIDRSNDHRPMQKSNSVGLLRDSQGLTTEIILPSGKDAILLTLGSEKTVDQTLDGRKTTNASKWYYVSQRPIECTAREKFC